MERELSEAPIREIKDERSCRHQNSSQCTCPHEPDNLDCLMCIRSCIFVRVCQIQDELKTGDVRLDFQTANSICECFDEIDSADDMLGDWIQSLYPEQVKEKRQQIMRKRAERDCNHYRI